MTTRVEIKIFISQIVVECGPSVKHFNDKPLKWVIVLGLRAMLLIGLLSFSLQTWQLQLNNRIPPVQLILITEGGEGGL